MVLEEKNKNRNKRQRCSQALKLHKHAAKPSACMINLAIFVYMQPSP